MTLAERLDADMKAAMRAGDTRRRDVIRYLRAAVVNAAIERRADLSDPEIESVIRTQIKQRRDSIELFRKGGRDELAEEEEAQIAVLLEYLPEQLSEDELVPLVAEVADRLDARSMRDMSRLMPALVEAVAGQAEGRVLSQLAKAELERRAASAGGR